MKNLIFILSIFLIFSCKEKKKERDFIQNATYQEQNESGGYKEGAKERPVKLLEVEGGYLAYQLVFYKDDSVYFYKMEKGIKLLYNNEIIGCIDSDRRNFINLKPEKIVRVPKKHVYEFLKANINESLYQNKLNILSTLPMVISSNTDTIFSKGLYDFMKPYKVYYVREITQEEEIVIEHFKKIMNGKMLSEDYNPINENWDTLKIHFNKNNELERRILQKIKSKK